MRTGRPPLPDHPPAETLRRMYVDEGKSTIKIGRELGFSNTAIAGWLRRAGVELRPAGWTTGRSKGSVDRVCPTCGEMFRTWPSMIANGRMTYCSKQCAGAAVSARTKGVPWTPERIAKRTASRRANTARTAAEVLEARRLRRQEVGRRANLAYKHHLTLEAYDALLASQDGVCAICRGEFNGRAPHIDHDHVTNAVRGILCFSCNTALGHFRDSVDVLHAAIAYLEARRTG